MKRRQDSNDSTAVEVFDVSASRVLDVEHLGSNGPASCFFVDDGKALLLVGQWLLEYASFPNKSFRLYRRSDTKKPIRIEVIGNRVEPEHSTVRLLPNYRVTKVQMFDATPETLQEDLGRALRG
ncbi:MAG: hypothetical protein WBL63_01575 [Candidatus Acidiferrum sp.]